MAQLLTWSEVDSNIQNEMGNRCPDESKRLEAINNEVRNINTVYDIETTKRRVEVSIIPDGTPYKVSDLVNSLSVAVIPNDDMKKVADIYRSDDTDADEYIWIEPEEFFRNIRNDIVEDKYTTYFQDGYMYIAVNSVNGETTAIDYTINYYSTYLAFTSSAFAAAITASADCSILLPARFKDLVVAGAKKRLLWPSIGEDGNNQYVVESNRYKAEIAKLGLDNVAKPLKKTIRKLKLRPPTNVTKL